MKVFLASTVKHCSYCAVVPLPKWKRFHWQSEMALWQRRLSEVRQQIVPELGSTEEEWRRQWKV